VYNLSGYIARRLLHMCLTLFVLLTLLFFLFRVIPGDPISMYIESGLSPEAQEALLHQYGLDRPLLEQYGVFLRNMVHGDFGDSFQYNKPAIRVVWERFWPTVLLMGTSLLVAFIIGVFGGAILAWRRGTLFETLGTMAVLAVRSAPVFWTGMILLSLFAFRLQWLPLGGMNTPGTNFEGWWDKYVSLDFLRHLILPVLTASLYSVASPMLVMRSSMLETVREDYVELARAKGLSEMRVLFFHAVRNALLPVVTVMAVMAGFAIGGVVLVETVFRWPGMGREIVMAVSMRDYPLAQAAFFFVGVLISMFNLAADVIYAYLDPRISYAGRTGGR